MALSNERLTEAKARDIWEIAQALEIGDLARHGHEWVGPCPKCGGEDRFAIDTRQQVFLCRKCDGRGDVVSLVRWMRGLTLPAALDWILGPEQDLPAEERAERRRRSEANQAKLEARAAREREEAMRAARKIWGERQDPEGGPVRGYLERRGFSARLLPQIPQSIGYHPALPYMVSTATGWAEVHRGPAMIAAIQAPDRTVIGLHRTWIDLGQPKGKAELQGPDGRPLKAKKTLGAKKGGVIRLRTPREFDTIVMAEGIETTLTAMVSGLYPDAAWWCAVDLGNIAGRRQSGRGLKYAGLPDMADTRAWYPPPWLRRLILVEDGDSDPRLTRAQLEAGARRAMALVPGLKAQIVPCPPGLDLNDVLLGGGEDESSL